ncbi:unnamed protein product [Larinioides sclopetarius]|uniref:Uncharacterized protein n=1 Tax=Larinioides sclopetarius TaxID=280406 RepID=A0AAV2B2A3_9ARAC
MSSSKIMAWIFRNFIASLRNSPAPFLVLRNKYV